MSSSGTRDDAALVTASRAGDRDAFGEIVARYQSLICSLAYSCMGNIGHSEDVAQETFLSAWQHLGQLREPAKLRAWLCTIARNRINRSLGREGKEPSHAAETLDAAHEAPAIEPLPSDRTITREEEAILWRSLERIPEVYREPLVLFYREHQSIERVAAALEISEDAVKQRLSRGRKLLQEQIAAFVTGALEQTGPDRTFTLSVLAALPAVTVSTTAATAGATVAKGYAAVKALGLASLAGVILGPIVGIASGWLGYKVSLENATSPREEAFLRRMYRKVWAMAGIFCAMVGAFVLLPVFGKGRHPMATPIAMVAAAGGYAIALWILIRWASRTQQTIRAEEAASRPPGTPPVAPVWQSRPFEYRSAWTLLGLPLVHVRMECKQEGRTLPAVGWVAVGNKAYGVLLAFGGWAVGTVSVGGAAVGLVSIGGCGVGLLSIAGVAIGYWAIGGTAVGYLACGGTALGWLAASGGSAAAHDFAVGGAVAAQHANDAAAQAFMQGSGLFRSGAWLTRNLMALIWLPMLLVVWQMVSLRRTARRKT